MHGFDPVVVGVRTAVTDRVRHAAAVILVGVVVVEGVLGKERITLFIMLTKFLFI